MKKNALIYLGLAGGIFAVASTVLFASRNETSFFSSSKAPLNGPVYKHYNAIAPTENEHGCSEFWVNCSDFSYVLEQPTEGSIVEGGNITDNPSFDWNSMDYLDGRFIPSINQEKAWGMVPVIDSENNTATYGLYPQTVVDDSTLLETLESLTDESKDKNTGYYYYEGNFYQNCIGARRDSDSHFSNGATVEVGVKYWFTCEPISWKIMSSVDSTYQMYTSLGIYSGLTWGFSNTDTYETSRVRAWLIGTGTYVDEGFLQTALFESKNYLQSMTTTLDDGSATLNDKVRLLTKGEANDSAVFASKEVRKISPSDWAAAHKACFNSSSSSISRWWLCEGNLEINTDPEKKRDTTMAWGVGLDGVVGNGGRKTSGDSYDRCIRPCITLTIA